VYGGQFIQVLKPWEKDVVMSALGKFLMQLHRRVLLVHALPEDNLGAEWGDTIPYSMHELLFPLQAGAGATHVTATVMEKIPYYSQVYSFIRFMAE
jgi:hypothetical protein